MRRGFRVLRRAEGARGRYRPPWLKAAVGSLSASRRAMKGRPMESHEKVTAVDILLEPDATMIERASIANARLLAVYPEGFALDAAHRPHVTMVQRYFATAQLDEVYAAVKAVLGREPVASWRLTAFGYYYLPWQNLGLAGIVVRPIDELVRLQSSILAAVAPYVSESASDEAFVRTPDDPEINQPTIDYVAAFATLASGANFNPHVTIGLALQDDLNKMKAEPFEEFTFSAVSASAYHLGNFGTAATQLRSWDLHS